MKIGIIGAGNMAGAIIKSIGCDVYVSDIDESKLQGLPKNAIICGNNIELYEKSGVIILAVKPNAYPALLRELSEFCDNSKLYVSIAAGVTINSIKSYFSFDPKIIRIMPNTSALVLESMTVMNFEPPVSETEFDFVKGLFDKMGKTEILPEKLMDAAVSMNGSSPAYVYLLIEAMADGGVGAGLPRDVAYRLAAQSILGAAKMVLETKEHPASLKDKVCSPAGTTIAAVHELERGGFRASVIDAVKKCIERSKELSK